MLPCVGKVKVGGVGQRITSLLFSVQCPFKGIRSRAAPKSYNSDCLAICASLRFFQVTLCKSTLHAIRLSPA